jgi:O-methyltransferase
MITGRIPPLRRFFQLQIPQRFRPTVTSVLAKTVGQVNFEAPAVGLTAVAYWARFSRWCRMHPVPGQPNGTNGNGRTWLYESAIEQEGLDRGPVTYLEFGVYRGESLRWWIDRLSHSESRFVGFDTFTGLPERWRPTEPAGAFDAKGKLPEIEDSRCSFEVGLFQDTLLPFVRHNDLSGRLIINLDADMFTSTLFVLATLCPYLKTGDMVFFDEFSCPLDEYRAFEEFVRSFRINYRVVGAVYGYTRVCVAIV